MDEPNLMQNSTSISSDKKDNMTSVSSPKRTIVLGVVNTAGMKSTNLNRKRRWDQPPDDFSGTPIVKKLCLSENETFPVKEIESPEAATAVTPNVDRINSQCEYSGVPNQSSLSNSAENEEISKGLLQSHTSNETNAMLIDLPEDKSNRLTPPTYEPSSDITLCSEQLEKLSEVNVLETCDRLQCTEKVNSHVPDSRINAQDDSLKAESLCDPISATKTIKSEQKGSESATVVSHQSDELRRIMFSYDEGSSDSDATESINYKDEKSGILTSSSSNILEEIDISKNKNVCINDVPQIGGNVQAITIEKADNDSISKSLASKETDLSENSDRCVPPSSDILTTPSNIQLKFDSKETDAFIDNSKSLENVGGIEESLIESQQNIPNKGESVEISNDQGDSVVSETFMKQPENDKASEGVLHPPESENEEPIKELAKNDNCAQDMRDLEACSPNSDKISSRPKNEFESTSLGDVVKTIQDVESSIDEKNDSEITFVSNQVDINHGRIEGNQIHLSVLRDNIQENKDCLDDRALGNSSVSQAAFETVDEVVSNNAISDQAVTCDTGQFVEGYSARVKNSDLNVVESSWKTKNIMEVSNESSNVVFRSNVEPLLEMDKPCKDKNASHISDAPCIDPGQSAENVENKCKFQVDATETTEVTLNAQESVEVTCKTVCDSFENVTSSNVQNTTDIVRNSEAETLNLDKSKLSISKDQYSEITDNDTEGAILRSDDSHHSDIIANTSNENIAVISAPIQELAVDESSVNVDISDENIGSKHFHNIIEESTSKDIPDSHIIKEKKNITEEVHVKDNIYNLAPENLPLRERESASLMSKENMVLSDSLDVKDIDDSISASNNKGPAVLEVTHGSQEQTSVDDTAREESIVSRNTIEADLKYDKVQELNIDKFSETNVNVPETKIDTIMINQEEVVIETVVGESDNDKNVCNSYEDNTNITDCSKPEKHVSFKLSDESVMITDDSNIVVSAGIDNEMESGEAEAIDQNNGTEIKVNEKSEEEFSIQDSAKVYDGNNIDSYIGIEIEMNEETNKSIITSIENAETDNNSVESTDAELGSIQTSEMVVDKKITKIEIVESPKRELDTVKDTKTEDSSLEVIMDTEIKSVDNNEIELGTEETIETEISIVENVENELCSLENDQIIAVETRLNSMDSAENIVNTEEKIDLDLCSVGNDITMECSGNSVEQTPTVVNRINNDENIELNIVEEVTLNEDIAESVFESNEANINIEVQKYSPSGTSFSARTKIDYNKVSSESTEMYKDTEIIETSKESVFEEEITVESSTVEECVFETSSITMIAGGSEEISIDSTSYEGILNDSPEESKDFVDSFDVSETVITDETPVGDNLMLESIENEVLIEDETKTVAQEVDITDKLGSPAEVSSEISFVEENMLQDDPKSLTDDIESFVVEEVVTCESPGSDKGMDYELSSANEDMPSPSVVLEETCRTTASLGVNAVIKENTVDLEVSTNDNQNKVITESNLDLNNSDKLIVEKSALKHIVCNKELEDEPSLNSIRSSSPLIEMECDTSVDSITETDAPFKEEEMKIGEQSCLEMPDVRLKRDSIKVEKTPTSVLNAENDVPSVVKHIGINVPLLKTVTNSVLLRKEKPPTPVDEISRFGNIPGLDPKLEPITLRIYKDNLSVKTDDLDSPKKTKSPKLSSELKSQLSPHFKSSENRSSLSPTTKKLEFTLKIAKDVNTNVPRATMSPKNNISPSGIHKSGDILRAELTGESGRSSSAYISSNPGTNKVKLKVPKHSPPGIRKEYNVSHMQSSSIKEEMTIKEEMMTVKKEVLDPSAGVSLPKPSIEIGTVFKKMMESEKSIDSKSGIDVLDQLQNPVTPTSVPSIRKRGRPRKILQKVLTMVENEPNINSDLDASHNPATPLNHSPEDAPPALDISSGVENSEQISSRQVRSCRARTKPIVVKTRKPRGGGAARGGVRGKGGVSSTVADLARALSVDKDAEKLVEKLSEREKAELAKIKERKEKQRLENIARNEAKKAKKLAQRLRDEARRQKKLRERAEKAEAAAPQVFEEETRMSAPDGGSRGHTPAPASVLSRLNQTGEHEESQNSISTPTSSQIKRGRMEIPIDPECKEVRVEQLAEYHWQGSELYMIQEQVSMYLGVKSFKRKYPSLKRRPVEAEERTFLEDSGLVTKSMCDLGLTAVSSAEVLDIMYQDFPEKYEEFRRYVREKQAKEASFKQKIFANLKQDKSKGEPREQALEAVAMWNSNLNKERREERRCALDLQTFTVHYPRQVREKMSRPLPKCGMYPVSLLPGQFSDFYKVYTPTELHYFPLNTVMYGPLKPNERQPINPSDGSGSDISSSSTSDDSSGSSSSDSETEDEGGVTRECKICNGEKKTNKESHPEILLQCSSCKGLCHPTCQEITPEMLPHIKKYNWHCSNCKKCMQCKNATKDDKMLFCDLCDRGYHIHCVGLKKAPEGRWHCSVCSFCTLCGSKDPGGPEWNYEYKKTDKGVRLYQRTLCVPCSKNALM